MYLPPHFEERRPEVLRRLVDEHPLGLLVTWSGPPVADADPGAAAPRLVANPIPWRWREASDAAGTARSLVAHVARANPVWRETPADAEVLLVFQGPQAYVSPSSYAAKRLHGKVVPTWNYLVAQARGRLVVHDDRDWLRALVGDLTDQHEAGQPHPWSVGDAPDDYIATMLGAIVGVEVRITEWVGKWKLSQNRSAEDRRGVAEAHRAAGGVAGDLAGWMGP